MSALLVGTLLAIVALGFVLWPLFDERPGVTARRAPRAVGGSGAIEALREIEFDRETGKLSDADYAELKAAYTRTALAELRAQDAADARSSGTPAGDAATGEDAAEAAIRRWRERKTACPACGPRPEPDAIYCSSCGHYLAGQCAHCGAAVEEPGAGWCVGCGSRLAA